MHFLYISVKKHKRKIRKIDFTFTFFTLIKNVTKKLNVEIRKHKSEKKRTIKNVKENEDLKKKTKT